MLVVIHVVVRTVAMTCSDLRPITATSWMRVTQAGDARLRIRSRRRMNFVPSQHVVTLRAECPACT